MKRIHHIMKKLIFTVLFVFGFIRLSGQTQGINYQAVIIDKNPQEIPGRDISGNFIPNQPVMFRFSILDAAGTIEYQEEQATVTDMYGMVNLVIGLGTPTVSSPATFSDIDWNGTPKSLKVDLSLSDTDIFFFDFSLDELTYVPYAFHRNITATGSLIVDGMTNLKSRLDVSGGSPAFLSGTLDVKEKTTLDDVLTVNAASNLKGQVTINPGFESPGNKSNYDSYPLRIEGGTQGIAIKIDGTRSSDNYFVTFWDDEKIQGRIEGQTLSELDDDPEYFFENFLLANSVFNAGVDVTTSIADLAAASSSSTVCAGLGACVTSPVPSLIVAAAAKVGLASANLALAIAEQVMYNESIRSNIGVTYQSGSGDYAEWLPKADRNEKFSPGDIVGVKGGYISKSTAGADHFMVISHSPIILGNMPGEADVVYYEKVAFMGQVPAKVSGKASPGDFILPSGRNDGTGVAVSPENIEPGQYSKIVGVAWSETLSGRAGFVNTAVGINANIPARLGALNEERIKEQEAEINDLKTQIGKMNDILVKTIPEYAALMEKEESGEAEKPEQAFASAGPSAEDQRTVVYHEITAAQLITGLNMAENILREKGVDTSENPFFNKIKTDPGYRDSFINSTLAILKTEMDKNYNADVASGAKVIRF